MAVTAVELSEYSPRTPTNGCVVGNYIVAWSGAGTYAVFDTVSQTSRAFTIPLNNLSTNDRTIVAANGYAWLIGVSAANKYEVVRVNPATGGRTSFLGTVTPRPGRTDAGIIFDATSNQFVIWVCDGYSAPRDLFTGYRVDAATMAVSGLGLPQSYYEFSAAVYGGVLHAIRWPATGAGTVYSRTISTAATLTAPASFPGQGVLNAGVLYAGATVWDWATQTVVRTIPTVPGAPAFGPDGLLYGVSSTQVVAVDVTNGATRTETLPVTRTERSSIFSVGGKLWSPSGAPF